MAEIEDGALLGLDIFMNGPVNLKLHENLITFREKDIEVQQTTAKIRRVLAADDFNIPAYCEQSIYPPRGA